MKGLEPPRLAALDPKSSASTNSATSANWCAKIQYFDKCKVLARLYFICPAQIPGAGRIVYFWVYKICIVMLAVKDLAVVYNTKTVFKDFSFEIGISEKLCITGKSGKGKSSLIDAIFKFVELEHGSVVFKGKSINAKNVHILRSAIAWMPQNLSFSNAPVLEFLKEPFSYKQNKNMRFDETLLYVLLSKFELETDILQQNMDLLSDGEKQRLALILCLLLKRELLVLDEPTSALDLDIKQKVMDYLFAMKEQTILFVTHDQDLMNFCDRIVYLK
jgi:UDP-glucose/iron transport system ATP-binding protein